MGCLKQTYGEETQELKVVHNAFKIRGKSDVVGYRYGFNGKENDPEDRWQDYGMRMYDTRLGRFFSVDPITHQYPELTPYQFASNSPIAGIDQDGLELVITINTESSSGKTILNSLKQAAQYRRGKKERSGEDIILGKESEEIDSPEKRSIRIHNVIKDARNDPSLSYTFDPKVKGVKIIIVNRLKKNEKDMTQEEFQANEEGRKVYESTVFYENKDNKSKNYNSLINYIVKEEDVKKLHLDDPDKITPKDPICGICPKEPKNGKMDGVQYFEKIYEWHEDTKEKKENYGGTTIIPSGPIR